MGPSFEMSSLPNVSALSQAEYVGQPTSTTSNTPRTFQLAAQVGWQLLMPSSFFSQQIASIFVARKMVPPPRLSGQDRDERSKRGEFIRRVKVAKSEPSGQRMGR